MGPGRGPYDSFLWHMDSVFSGTGTVGSAFLALTTVLDTEELSCSVRETVGATPERLEHWDAS